MGSNSGSAKLIFKRNVQKDMGEASLTAQMLEVMMTVDGRKTLAEVNEQLTMSPKDFKEAINKLYKLKLIVPVEKAEMVCLNRDFFITMNKLLADSVGPMSSTLITDAAKKIGYQPEQFPVKFGGELINSLSQHFYDAKKKELFLKTMKEILSA